MIEKIYIGSYSNNITICEFEEGNLKVVGNVKNVVNPSYLHINKDILYAVSETKIGSIEAFRIEDNALISISKKTINQALPCYITTNLERNSLLVSNYESGSVIMYSLNTNGSLGRKKYFQKYENSNMHFAEFIQDNIYAVDLGNSKVYIYNEKMQLLDTIQLDKDSGPRHLVMSKDKKTIYIVTELSNKIYVYEKNNGKFKLIQKISTLIDDNILKDQNIKTYAGAIKISSDYKNIYVTNRGHNSISVFSIKNNKLEYIQNISTYGEFPRDILLNQNEEYLMVANQKSNNIVIYKRDMQNGMLSVIENSNLKLDKPSCIVRRDYEI